MNSVKIQNYITQKEKEYFQRVSTEELSKIDTLYKPLYQDIPLESLQKLFSYFHYSLNKFFSYLNPEIPKRYCHADNSRYMLNLIEEIETFQLNINDSSFSFTINEKYKEKIKECSRYLVPSGGSEIPEEVERIGIVETRPIFHLVNSGENLFRKLIAGLYRKNPKLAKLFDEKIHFISFDNKTLSWNSNVSESEKQFLENNWMLIRTYVQEIFGFETKIKNTNYGNEEQNTNHKIEKYIFSNINDIKINKDFEENGYKNILLKGVPGTGKSRTIDNIIKNQLNLGKHLDSHVLRINIHSASSNADLMQGIGISSNEKGEIEYKERQGLIFEFIEKATFNPNQPFALVLEEIQENSLNELIGDLIYLIEDSKRAKGLNPDNKEYTYRELVEKILKDAPSTEKVKMPNLISQDSKAKVMIMPDNLFFFCTSNYRDDRRVIEDNLLRRFDVIEVYPKYKNDIGEDFKSSEVSDFLEALNKSIVEVCSNNGEIH
ncbi:MAG TPA: hypothetical protein ENK91_05240, partial [Bacteroidetes bacterium]|nr:hypothetical protein [Bacteroidota bacterium]